jgi:lipopolysaccharide/colanic/teichoic acid biosynthesis glycosyltransferase
VITLTKAGSEGAAHRRVWKKQFDYSAAILALGFLAPLMGLVAFLVWIILGRPIFFSQERPGLNGRVFRIWKFRSMTLKRDPAGALLADQDRLTFFGHFLRSTSLDELPELYNVVRGDMSLVGPRPLLTEYIPRYNIQQRRRHEVRPGITGLTQVMGRNALTWEEKFDLDVWYVDHVSFRLDLQILALTVWKILKREGISQPGHATMEEFRGSGQ